MKKKSYELLNDYNILKNISPVPYVIILIGTNNLREFDPDNDDDEISLSGSEGSEEGQVEVYQKTPEYQNDSTYREHINKLIRTMPKVPVKVSENETKFGKN